MIEEIKSNGLDNKPIKTKKKPPPRSINEIHRRVILQLSLSVVKARVKLIH
jgi:hypothetical protein